MTLSATSSVCFGAKKFASWLFMTTQMQFTLPEQSDWCDNMTLRSYNYAPVLPVKVSRPYFSTRPQGAREKFGVWGRDYSGQGLCIASFPGPAQLSVTCKRQKAGRGLGTRLGYANVMHIWASIVPSLSLSMPPTTQLRLAPSDDHHLSSRYFP